jgi:sulfonate transport system ATP-binding protein
MLTTSAAVHVRDLHRSFAGRTVLDGLDLDIEPGQFVALLGASGGGKSTLLKILAGLDTGTTSTLEVPAHRAVAFQSPRLLPWKRVWQNVVLGLPSQPGQSGRARALEALAEVGLEARVDAWPKTLSGGEAQRAALARALVRTPELLLLDEPFAALDALTRLKAQRLVRRLWERHGFTVLLVTHDVDESLLLADRILVLDGGRIGVDVAVDVPQPRNIADTTLVALRRQLLSRLGVDEQ